MGDADDILVRRARGRIGQTIRDKWRLERLLGVGGMAAVYEASHRNGKRVAVKWLHNELTVDSGARGRFLREGYIANKVGHPGAVSVLDDDTAEDGALVLVMELLEGETIDARGDRVGTLPAPEVLIIAYQVLDVLAAAHGQGIVHRDLKPENLFLTRSGAVKVLDFGIARLRELHVASDATVSRASLGTPGFMPPEQARGRSQEIDGRTDIWALGATMFMLLTGRHVHEAATVNEQLLAAMTQPAPALRGIVPDEPDAVARVVDRALAFDKSDRWADAREMQLAVREAYRELTGGLVTEAPPLVPVETGVEEADDPGPLSETLPVASTERSVVSPARQETTARSAGRSSRLRWIIAAASVVAIGTPVALLVGRPAGARHEPPPPASATTVPHATPPAASATIAGVEPPVGSSPTASVATAAAEVSSGPPPVSRAVARPTGRPAWSRAVATAATGKVGPPPAATTTPPATAPTATATAAPAAPSADPLDRRR